MKVWSVSVDRGETQQWSSREQSNPSSKETAAGKKQSQPNGSGRLTRISSKNRLIKTCFRHCVNAVISPSFLRLPLLFFVDCDLECLPIKLPTIWQVSISASGSWCTKIMNQLLPLSMIQRYDNWACLPEKLLMLQGVTVSRSRRVNWCRRRSPAIFSAGCFFRLDTLDHFLRELRFRALCNFYVAHSCETFSDCGFSLIMLTIESAVAIRKISRCYSDAKQNVGTAFGWNAMKYCIEVGLPDAEALWPGLF